MYDAYSKKAYFDGLNNEANKQVTKLLLYALVAGAFLYIVSRYFFLGAEISTLLKGSSIILACGLVPYLVFRIIKKVNLTIFATIVMSSLGYIYLLFDRPNSRGLTVWAASFVFLAISLLYLSKAMVISMTTVSITGNLIYLILFSQTEVKFDGSDYIARIGIIVVTSGIALYANYIFKERLELNFKQINEINILNTELLESEQTLRTQQNQLIELYKEVDTLAYTDILTGLPNRNFLEKEYVNSTHNYLKEDTITAFITIDLDRFKQLNDIHGQQIGDSYIIKMKDVMGEVFNEDQYKLFRISGDRFLLIVNNLQDKNDIIPYIIEIKKSYEMNQGDLLFAIKLGMSMGIAFYPQDGFDFEELLHKSDISLQHVKNSYRGEFKFYSKNLMNAFEWKVKIQTALFECIKQNELHVCYQPIHKVSDGSITGFEALMRWESKALGPISPIEFIPYSEENRMILDMGEWILEEAIKTIHRINEFYGTSFSININVSSIQLRSTHFMERLKDVLYRVNIRPDLVQIEITENMMIESLSVAVNVLKKMKELGVRIALDDFGTGYSSLSYLKNLPIDVIKIDRMFIMEIDIPKERAIIKTILDMAHQLKKEVIAEGIETEEQLRIIGDMGCDYAQGFLMAKPFRDTELNKYIEGTI